jgi:hypothetical protein
MYLTLCTACFNAQKLCILLTQCTKYTVYIKGKGKGKAIPLQAWTGP